MNPDELQSKLAELRAENEQVHAENEELRAENEQLRETAPGGETESDYLDLHRSAPLPTVTLDGVGVIHAANPEAVSLLSAARFNVPVPIVGKRLRRFVHPADENVIAGHLRQCASTATAVCSEIRLRDDRPFQVWSKRTGEGARRYATIFVEMTGPGLLDSEAQRLRQAAHAARTANDAKDRFIGALSHELRTPLGPILVAATSLAEREDVPESLRATCAMIRRNVLIETRLVDDLLDVTRITRGKMRLERRSLDVHSAVREVADMMTGDAEAKMLSLRVLLQAEQNAAVADPVRVKQVFWNLVRNAVTFTDPGGSIELRSWNSVREGKTFLCVEVSDTGLGFDASGGVDLFEPFEQGPERVSASGGLGLGLAICKGIMDLHGGSIAAHSRGAGLGARFVVEFQTTTEEPEPVAVARRVETLRPHSPPRLLLVDDHDDTAALYGALLQNEGYQVQTAESGREALAADLDQVDLLVSDIGLPDISGLELMRRLKVRSIVGIAMSGYGTEDDRQASKDAGFSAHLVKPVDFDLLLTTIQSVRLERAKT